MKSKVFSLKIWENYLVLMGSFVLSYLSILTASWSEYWGVGMAIVFLLFPTIFYIYTFRRGGELGEKFTFYFLNLIVLVLYFGFLYKDFGIKVPGKEEAELFDAFYFSVVTWTTLGYGDIVPTSNQSKILVMVEVLLGYIYLGILVGKVSFMTRFWEDKKPLGGGG